MKHDLTLVALNQEQITKAKEVNGKRKQITHAVPTGSFSERKHTAKSIILPGRKFSQLCLVRQWKQTSMKYLTLKPRSIW